MGGRGWARNNCEGHHKHGGILNTHDKLSIRMSPILAVRKRKKDTRVHYNN
jgi:hypothetical protein